MGQGVILIPLVRVSIINVGLGFLSKIWILAFLGKYSNIFVGFQSVSIKVRIIWYQSTGSKISFLSLLSFVSCYHKKNNKIKKKWKKKRWKRKVKEKKRRDGNYWKHCGKFNWGQIWGWVHNSQSSSLSWFVEDDYTISWFSWSRTF